MTIAHRIGLGTVQFGLDYGISNRAGRPGLAEVKQILQTAIEAGIGYLDTATTYGQAEEIVGKCMPAGHGLKVVTKIPPIAADTIGVEERDEIVASVAGSIERLNINTLHGILIHRVSDLNKPGAEFLVEALQQAQSRGWVKKIGVSIYNDAELLLAEQMLNLDLVQVPFNILDTRLVESGSLMRLDGKGVEVHARSVFLQGLLLMDANALPSFFAPVRDRLGRLYAEWDALKLGRLATCLAFVLQRPELQCAVIGVNRLSELQEILAALVVAETAKKIPVSSANIEPDFLDPSRWPSFR